MVVRDVDLSVETYIPIAKLAVGQSYNQVFLIDRAIYSEKMIASSGAQFTKVVLKDTTGEISGIIWGDLDELIDGTYIRIKILVCVYKGTIGFEAESTHIKILDEAPINILDYIKGISPSIVALYTTEIETEVTSMDDHIYRSIMCNAMHGLDLIAALRDSPYGLDDSMSYPGGLLVHVVHSLRLAKIACKQATELEMKFSPSLVVAGCLLRNIGWHTTTRFQGARLYLRDAHRMTGIYRASARYIDHLLLTSESDLQIIIPESKKQALENMCNTRENINTLEGQIVSCADNMADVLDFGNASLQRKRTGNWIDNLFVGHL